MRLYKYRAIESEGQLSRVEEILRTGEFWFASALEVNDPFEFRTNVNFAWDLAATAEAFALVEMHVNPGTNYADALTKSRAVLNGISSTRLRQRQWELSEKLWRAWSQMTTMCCLAGTPRSLLMWSHYGGSHKGVAIEIDIPDRWLSDPIGGTVHRVEYSDDLPQINPLSLVDVRIGMKERLFQTLFLRKSKCWEYEEEYRVMQFNPNGSHSRRAPLPQGSAITRVVAGCAMPVETRERLKKLIETTNPSVHLAYALPASDSGYAIKVMNAIELDA